MRTFSVDMIPGGSQTAIACNQFERGDVWAFALYYNGGRFQIPAGATVAINGTKNDKAAFEVSASVADNTVIVTVTEQMTAAAGKCVAELMVVDGSTVLYTANFYLLIEPAAVQGDTVPSEIPSTIVDKDGNVYVQSKQVLPTDGEAGEVLTSDGNGGVYWSAVGEILTPDYNSLSF